MCLSRLFDRSTKSALACPECKTVTDLSNGLDKLPINWTVERALQSSQSYLKASTPPVAPSVSNCATHPVPAILFCKDCIKLLCALCLSEHTSHFSALGPVEESLTTYVGLLNDANLKVSTLLDNCASDIDKLQQFREKALSSLSAQQALVDKLVERGISQIKAKGRQLQDEIGETGIVFEKAVVTQIQALEASRDTLSKTLLQVKSLSSSAVALGPGSIDWSTVREAESSLKEIPSSPSSPSIELLAQLEVPIIEEDAIENLIGSLSQAIDSLQLKNIPFLEIPLSSTSTAAAPGPTDNSNISYVPCPYGDKCTRKDANHVVKYKHSRPLFQANHVKQSSDNSSARLASVPAPKAPAASSLPAPASSSSSAFSFSYAAKLKQAHDSGSSNNLASFGTAPAPANPSGSVQSTFSVSSSSAPRLGDFAATHTSSAPGYGASPLARSSEASAAPKPSGPDAQLKSSNPYAHLFGAPETSPKSHAHSFDSPVAFEAQPSAEKRPTALDAEPLPTLGNLLAWSASTGWKWWQVNKLAKPHYAGAIVQSLDLQPLEPPFLYTHVAAAEQNPNHPSTLFIVSTDGKATIWSEKRQFPFQIEIPPIQPTSCQIFIVDNPETFDDPVFVIIDTLIQKTLQAYSKTGKSILSYSFPSPVISISVSQGNLLLGHGDGTITQQSLFGKRTKENWGVHKGTISNLTTVLSSPEGLNTDLVVSSALDKTLVATRLDNYRPQWITNLPSNALYVLTLPSSKSISSSSVSSSNASQAMSSAPKTNSLSGSLSSSASSALSSFSSLSISGDSKPMPTKLVAIMQDGKASIISSVNGAIETSYQAHHAVASAVAVTDRFIITSGGSTDTSIHIWDWKERHTYAICKHHTASIFKFKVFANGTRLVSLSRDGMVCLWSLGNASNPIPSLNLCFTPFTSLPEVFLICEHEE